VDSRIHNGKALVVDDSKTIRLILSQTLGELGWNVEQAPNGQVALTWLDSPPEPAGLVLIDWNMPEMNGLDLVRQIRERTRVASSKLMMVTTETETEQIENAIKAGANEYVMKPHQGHHRGQASIDGLDAVTNGTPGNNMLAVRSSVIPAGQRARILIVDDSVVIRRLITTTLARVPDFEVVGTAANGKIALDKIGKLDPDVVTLDIEMPVMNGLETLKAIRA